MIYDNLPVYKVSYDLLQKLFVVVHNFRKEYKYTIGETIKKEVIDLIIAIYRANSHKDKQKYKKLLFNILYFVKYCIFFSNFWI